MRIEIDGNDGAGKSTLVNLLAELGIEATDRGRMTRATNDDSIGPEEGVLYIHLHAPPSVCQDRLEMAEKDITERYHTLKDLKHYEARFAEVATRFKATTIESHALLPSRQEAVAAVLGHPLRIAIPKGRLQSSVLWVLSCYGYGAGNGKRPPGEPAEGGTFPDTRHWKYGGKSGLNQFNRSYRYQGEGLDMFLLKPRAIPQMVSMGFLDAGIVGQDILMDSLYDNLVEVGAYDACGKVRIMAAAADPKILENPPKRPLVVATEFPLIADRWLTDLNLAHIILHTGGSTEAYVPEFADIIIDVVDTGVTLEANGLTPIHTFLTSETVLITRPEIKDRLDIRAFAETEFTTRESA